RAHDCTPVQLAATLHAPPGNKGGSDRKDRDQRIERQRPARCEQHLADLVEEELEVGGKVQDALLDIDVFHIQSKGKDSVAPVAANMEPNMCAPTAHAWSRQPHRIAQEAAEPRAAA